MPIRQVAGGSPGCPARSRSGLWGARLVANTGPWTITSQVLMWTLGRSGVRTVTRSSSGGAAGERLEVVGAIDRRAVVAVVRARDDDGPDLGLGQARELRGDAFDRTLRLDVAVEQVAGDQEEVDLLGEREVDGGGEGGELPFTLGARLLAEVVVAGTEMDVGGMDDP